MAHAVADLMEFVVDRVAVGDECWEWTGSRRHDGYGQLRHGGVGAPLQRAHRVVYELFVEPVPDDLVLDHLCRNRGCVNPDHLEVVTIGENVRRGIPANSHKTHCPAGHPYDTESCGARRCTRCDREASRRYRAARSA